LDTLPPVLIAMASFLASLPTTGLDRVKEYFITPINLITVIAIYCYYSENIDIKIIRGLGL
jgi:hypothetical protein